MHRSGAKSQRVLGLKSILKKIKKKENKKKKEKERKEKMKNKIIELLENRKNRSAWDKGVNEYALELVEGLGYYTEEELEEMNKNTLEKTLLNGADSWGQYSWGGCSLIYNQDIAERLCCKSELLKTKNGERRPNSHEEWLDTQARALHQAAARVCRAWEEVQTRKAAR